MNSIEEVRQIVLGAFVAMQQAEYPDLTVELPNKETLDLDNQQESFVKAEIYFPKTSVGSMGAEVVLDIQGRLYLSLYVPKGTGSKEQAEYQDTLLQELAYHTIDGVNFSEVKASEINNPIITNWDGKMFSLHFRVASNYTS